MIPFDSETLQLWVGAGAVMCGLVGALVAVRWIRIERDRWTSLHPNRGPLVDSSFEDEGPGLVATVLDSFATSVQRITHPALLEHNQALLDRAGPRRLLTARRLLAIRWMSAPTVAVLAYAAIGSLSGELRVLSATFIAFLASRVPGLWLSRLADRRVRLIDRELPDILDQITISVGAGLGLDAAITRVAQRSRGALSSELLRTMQDIRIGVERQTALLNLARRSGSEEIGHLVSALLQGIEMGMPIAPVLEARAKELRRKRKTAAEEKAHKLSVKLTFPTAVCILPALLLIVIGPAVLSVMDSGLGA